MLKVKCLILRFLLSFVNFPNPANGDISSLALPKQHVLLEFYLLDVFEKVLDLTHLWQWDWKHLNLKVKSWGELSRLRYELSIHN